MIQRGRRMYTVESEAKIFKLNRLFNIFNPQVYRFLALITVIITIFAFIAIANGQSAAVYISSYFLLIAIGCSDRCLRNPKKLRIGNDSVEFNDYISLKPRHSNVRSGIWYLKVSYRVTDIKNVEFHQNAIEKAFDVGRVSFTGNATFDAKRDLDRIKVPPKFVIYGIRNFSLAKFEIFKNK